MNRWFARHAEGVLDEEDIRRRAKELEQFIPEVLAAEGLQGRPVWALGFSNGANMAASMLLLYPKLFYGAILMRPMLPLLPGDGPNLENVPVYIAAGTQDTMIPQESTRRLVQILEEAGASLTTRWAQAGHGFGREEIELVREWVSPKIS
jgi:predicted esterase